MKKITDERLAIQNLKNIRISYIIQTLGIIAILTFDAITKGIDGMRENPLWLIFIVTAVVSAYLSMGASVDYENNNTNPKKGLGISLAVLVLISAVVGYFVTRTDGSAVNGIIMGGILLVCGLIPVAYIYKQRTNRLDEDNEE
jgi:hypothetical protein